MTSATITKQSKPVIKSITIRHVIDNDADTSMLGAYTDKYENHAIKRHNIGRHEYKYFVPGMTYQDHWDGLHKMGYSKGNCDTLARQYNQQDYQRMERLNRGDWCYMGIEAVAEIHVPSGIGYSQIQHIESGGLWGIESDAGNDYIKEIEAEEIADLKRQLQAFGISIRNFNKIEIKHKDS
jgi:hypothetical protein